MTFLDSNQLRLLALDAQAGNAIAFHELLTEIGKMAEPIVRKKLFLYNEVEDCVQEILISVHRALHTYDPSRDFKVWLNSICRHKIIDFLRVQFRKSQKEVMDDSIDTRTDSNVEPKESQQIGETVLKCLNMLPEKYRTVVQLTKIEGLSVKEASLKIGISESALKVRASRAYNMIRKKMETLKEDE